jgi:hypothetical protein
MFWRVIGRTVYIFYASTRLLFTATAPVPVAIRNFCASTQVIFTIFCQGPATIYNVCATVRILFKFLCQYLATTYSFCASIRSSALVSVTIHNLRASIQLLFTISVPWPGHCSQFLCHGPATVHNFYARARPLFTVFVSWPGHCSQFLCLGPATLHSFCARPGHCSQFLCQVPAIESRPLTCSRLAEVKQRENMGRWPWMMRRGFGRWLRPIPASIYD